MYRGRPPAGYKYEDGIFKNAGGEAFGAGAHAILVNEKKKLRNRLYYWERGGREQRLMRYVKRKKPKARQLKLCPDAKNLISELEEQVQTTLLDGSHTS